MASNISHGESLWLPTARKTWRKSHDILIINNDVSVSRESLNVYETLRFRISVETYRPAFHVNAFVASFGQHTDYDDLIVAERNRK